MACTYKENAKDVHPAFKCPLECSGKVTHVVPDYWRGKARKILGPDMELCTAHANWWGLDHGVKPKKIEKSVSDRA